jgi:threonine-phosphate decarboxylase
VLGRVPAHANLYVFRSLTKFYAIPGLRVGYLAGPVRGVARLTAAQPPWTLSTPSLAAAIACLAAEDFRQRTLESIPPLRLQLTEGLKDLGLTVYPSEANFLLARLPGMAAATLTHALRRQGILIRDCGNFPSLDGHHLRVAVRSTDDNTRLLASAGDFLAGNPGSKE